MTGGTYLYLEYLILQGGYLPLQGCTYLDWGGTYLGQGVPTLAGGLPSLARDTFLGWGSLAWPGVPTLFWEREISTLSGGTSFGGCAGPVKCQKDVKLSKRCQISKGQTSQLWRRFTKKIKSHNDVHTY